MSLQIVRFTEDHSVPAASLVVAHFGRLGRLDPTLPTQWLDAAARAQDIRRASLEGAGVAAVENSELVGFLLASLDVGGPIPETGWPTEASLGGARSGATRIGWHVAAGAEPRTVYRRMYAALAADLVAQQCFRHSIAVAVVDADTIDAWFGLGFGIDQITGSRDLAPLANPRPNLTVRRARPADIEALVRLSIEGTRYHASSPSFLPAYFAAEPVRRDMVDAMDNPQRSLWVAEDRGEVVGVMETTGLRRPSVNSARSETAISIGMAAIAEALRSEGVGSAILSRVLDWARSEGCGRCTVGWRSSNLLSDRFWRGHGFRPVHYVLTRHVDERIALAK